jgi:hypothetical protein
MNIRCHKGLLMSKPTALTTATGPTGNGARGASGATGAVGGAGPSGADQKKNERVAGGDSGRGVADDTSEAAEEMRRSTSFVRSIRSQVQRLVDEGDLTVAVARLERGIRVCECVGELDGAEELRQELAECKKD